jgi:hypothetical protein
VGPGDARLQEVFEDTLPYDRIWISNKLGAGGAPYTIPHPQRLTQWLINLGPDVYAGIASLLVPYTLTHEATHVWQGVTYGYGYILNSCWAQGCARVMTGDRGNAYNYSPGDA